jgi:hypothetical protein
MDTTSATPTERVALMARISFLPYQLNHEDALRICYALKRRWDGTMTLRDLERRHHAYPHIVEALAAAGFMRIEQRKASTGRPSLVAILERRWSEQISAAKLPLRSEQPKPLSFREEDFLWQYGIKCGRIFLGGKRGSGSAADAYRKVYGGHRPITPGRARSAGARLARQPWMAAGASLQRRLLYSGGGFVGWPRDLRNNCWKWLQLIGALGSDWPPDVAGDSQCKNSSRSD